MAELVTGPFDCPNCGDTHWIPDHRGFAFPCIFGMANKYGWTVVWAEGRWCAWTGTVTLMVDEADFPGEEWKKGS